MSRYGKIEIGFWQNPKTRTLSERAKLLLIYLFSCPHGNSVGCFVIRDGYIAADLEWDTETVTQTLSELFVNALVERDENTCLMRIVGWWGHNKIENENVAKKVLKDIAALPNCETKQCLIASILGLSNLHETVTKTLSEGLAKQFRTPNLTLTLTEPNLTKHSEPNGSAPGGAIHPVPPVVKTGEPHPLESPVTGSFEIVGEDDRAKLFRIGKEILISMNVPERRTGGLIGGWLKSCGDDCAGLLAAIQCARDRRVAEPIAWLTAVLKSGASQNAKLSPAERAKRMAAEARKLEDQIGLG